MLNTINPIPIPVIIALRIPLENPNFSSSSYFLISQLSPPKATTVLIAEIACSARLPALA